MRDISGRYAAPPLLLMVPVERGICLITLVIPFYAAAMCAFSASSSLDLSEGRRALRTDVNSGHERQSSAIEYRSGVRVTWHKSSHRRDCASASRRLFPRPRLTGGDDTVSGFAPFLIIV